MAATGSVSSIHSFVFTSIATKALTPLSGDCCSGCIATVATPFLIAGKKYNESGQIRVGTCDHGPLVFSVQQGSDDGVSKMVSLSHPIHAHAYTQLVS